MEAARDAGHLLLSQANQLLDNHLRKEIFLASASDILRLENYLVPMVAWGTRHQIVEMTEIRNFHPYLSILATRTDNVALTIGQNWFHLQEMVLHSERPMSTIVPCYENPLVEPMEPMLSLIPRCAAPAMVLRASLKDLIASALQLVLPRPVLPERI